MLEDFTTYTETDPQSEITVAENTITVANMQRDVVAHVYKNFGVNYFSGDFNHYLETEATSLADGPLYPWGLNSYVEDFNTARSNNHSHLRLDWYGSAGPYLRLYERDGASEYSDSSGALSTGTRYYLRVYRDEAVGDYGTIYCEIYSSAANRSSRSNAVDTLSVALHTSKKDYQYLYAMSSYYTGSAGDTASIKVYDLELEPVEALGGGKPIFFSGGVAVG